MSDHTHSETPCEIPQDECSVYKAVAIVCNDWDRETKKRSIQRHRGWNEIEKLLGPLHLTPQMSLALAKIYWDSHERPSIRPGKINV